MAKITASLATLAVVAARANVRVITTPEQTGPYAADFEGITFYDGPGNVNGSSGVTMNLVMMPDMANSMGAVCLDGTPAGFYFSPGNGIDAYNWIIYFQGGGWCYDPADCYGRSLTNLGSSKAWAKTANLDGMVSDNCNTNPTFCNYNRVYLVYCDGNSFSGNADQPYDFYGHNLFFRGHRIIDAVFSYLQQNKMNAPVPYSKAFDIVLTGCSAGGLATFLHADYVASLLAPNRPPPSGGPNRNGRYNVIPISGFFLDHNNVNGEPVYEDQIKVIFQLSNATYGVNDACIKANAGNEWRCNFAAYTYQHIKSSIFPLNSFYDSWQTGCIWTPEPVVNPNSTANGNCSAAPGWRNCAGNPEQCTDTQMTSLNQYRADFITDMNSTNTAGQPGNGGFIVSCHTHCEAQGGAWDTFKIGGVTMQAAVQAWLAAGPDAPSAQNWHFDCQYNADHTPRACNPTCG